MEGFSVLDSPEFEDWQMGEAGVLERELASALRRPADSWWPGHAPAQEAKCATVGKQLMSSPHATIRTCAA